MRRPPLSRIRWSRTCRLIPTRYPSVGPFDRVATAADVDAMIELEGWTNDRLSNELGLLHAVPKTEWVFNRPHASVVMAAFCHPRPTGARFTDSRRGAWYCSRTPATALAESAYHRTNELREVGHFDTRMQMRLYHADFSASFHDIRAENRSFAAFYQPDDYSQSQAFGRELFDAGSNGLVYRSVRHERGECVACFRPRLVLNVRVAAHYEFRWEGRPDPRTVRLHGPREDEDAHVS
jgi:RES domain